MYTKLEIKNFRGLKELTIDLKPITLVSGKNNTGKSSILESLFLFQDYANPQVFSKLLSFRGAEAYERLPQTVWEPLFHNACTDEPIVIRLNDDYTLALEMKSGYFSADDALSMINGINTIYTGDVVLSCSFKKGDYSFHGNYLLNMGVGSYDFFISSSSPPQPNSDYIQYLGPHVKQSDLMLSEWYGKIEISKDKTRKNKLIDILSIMDENITDVTTIASRGTVQLYFIDREGYALPIHAVGDGTRNVMQIILALLANPGCILLIDEVENGIHYSLHSALWKVISTLANQLECQIVATTHSFDCICGALDGIKEAGLENEFTYARLDKSVSAITPKLYSSDALERAINTDWEVR